MIRADKIKNVWMMNHQSHHDYLVNLVAQGGECKGFEINLVSLRESLWKYPDEHPKNDSHEVQVDKSRWIDASTMSREPLMRDGPTAPYA